MSGDTQSRILTRRRRARVAAVVGFGLICAAGCSSSRTSDSESVAQTREAFITNDAGIPVVWPTDSQWSAVRANGAIVFDFEAKEDATGDRDIVGDATDPSVYVYGDAYRAFFRLRIWTTPIKSGTTLDPFGWGCELDTDGNPLNYEFLTMVNGIVQGDEVELTPCSGSTCTTPNGQASGTAVLYSPLVGSSTVLNNTPDHARVVQAPTSLEGSQNYFIDWAFDLNDLPSGTSLSNPFRVACGTSNNAKTLDADLASPSGAVTFPTLFSDPITCGSTGCNSCQTTAACGPSCAKCTGTTSLCNPSSGCVQCLADADCTTGQFCDTQSGACVAKLANGTPIPTVPGHAPPLNGTCTPSVGVAVCASGVCDTVDNACGLANGLTCDPATGATTCRSGLCATTGPNAGKCVACLTSSTCASATPVCDPTTNTCVVCNGDLGTAATDACPVSTSPFCTTSGTCGVCASNPDCTSGTATHAGPNCNAGACTTTCTTDLQCPADSWCNGTTCTPKTPNGQPLPVGTCSSTTAHECMSGACDPTDNKCGLATGDACTPATGAVQCRSGLCPATGPNANKCVQCVTSATCPAATPVCNAQNTCVGCNGDMGTSATSACPSAGAPFCEASGACGKCSTGADCTTGAATHAGPFCNPTTGTCTTTCTLDTQCASGSFCDNLSGGTNTCTPKAVNGTPVPGGTCNATIAPRVCVSGVCDPLDNQCGLPNGLGCTAGTQCRSTHCSSAGVCVQCTTSQDCPASAPVCDPTTFTCGAADGGAGDAGVDAGGTDAGADASGTDAGTDAGGTDASADASGTDSGADASGTDASGPDAAADAGDSGAGGDAASDSGGSTDSGSGGDAASDSGAGADSGAAVDSGGAADSGADGGALEADTVEGGGCDCTTGRTRAPGGPPLWLAAAGILTFLGRRRRRAGEG